MIPHRAILPILTAESGLTRYLEQIQRFPMLEAHEEYMLAKMLARARRPQCSAAPRD